MKGERVAIPGGTFSAGSVPGEPGRDPALEPRLGPVTLGAFQIDRLPYPNDPDAPPKRAASQDEAERLCAARRARLCTELEWERACKGPDSSPYPTGEHWQDACASGAAPAACSSGFRVLGMGTSLEWTASSRPKAGAVLRGAGPTEGPTAHRCAHRATESSIGDGGATFRCCRGAPNAAVVKEPAQGAVFRKAELDLKALEAALAGHPATRDVATALTYFREPDASNTVIARGPGDRKGFDFTVRPLFWQPTAGVEYLVVSARSGEDTSFVVAFHVIAKDDYRLAASFIMKNEPGPVALAYSASIQPRMHFSTCWGCPGETGKLLHRKPDDLNIYQP